MASPRGTNSPSGSREATRTLPDRVGQVYYAHGLFCSSHPVPVISFAISIVLLCCYPLLNLPLPGNVPQQLSGNFSLLGDKNSSEVGDAQLPPWFTGTPMCYVQQIVMKTAVSPWTDDLVLTDAFRAPLAEVFKLLEVIRNYQHENSSRSLSHVCLHVESAKVKYDKKVALPEYNCLALSPANLWQQNREKFQEDSNLLGTVFSHQNLQKGKISLAEILFGMHMKDTGIKRYPLRTRQRVLQYAVTLVLQEHDPSYIEGLRQRLVSLYPLHQPHNSASLSQWASGNEGVSNVTQSPQDSNQEILHIYFPGQFRLQEFLPLIFTYLFLFLYMYFSVRKIELVKSKVGMAFSAVVTVLASLCMSVGLCFFFGLTLTMTMKEIFPYVVVIVGLENVLVLTKSVVSTPTHLDVKIRVAQGLSREGWGITKNLLIEVTILTAGLFTFVPAIQEFCIFAIVGLLSDYFLQMLFFSTVLAIDIRRMELTSESHHRIPYGPPTIPTTNRSPLRQFQPPIINPANPPHTATKPQARNIVRSKSHPRLNGLTSSAYPTNIVAPPNTPPATVKVPKRLRLVNFWASTRIFQRAFMVCMIVWIAFIMYSSGVLEHVLKMTSDGSLTSSSEKDSVIPTSDLIGSGIGENPEALRQYHDISMGIHPPVDKPSVWDDTTKFHSVATEEMRTVPPTSAANLKRTRETVEKTETGEDNDAVAKLKHLGYDPWYSLSHYHWLAILSLYNISLAGRYVSIMPPIRLSHAASPEQALSLRNPDEKAAHFQWQTLAAALDPLDFSDGGESGKGPVVGIKSIGRSIGSGEVPFVPSSPMELFLTAVLCVISIVVVAYTMVMLYRCVCSRNYAEWRASWTSDKEGVSQDGTTHVVMEAVPLVLDGHLQEVECLATDGNMIVSSCLGGQLRVWDSMSGEVLAVVERRFFFSAVQRNSSTGAADADLEEMPLSDYESGSPPSRGERTGVGDDSNTSPMLSRRKKHPDGNRVVWNLPDLRPAINTNFNQIKSSACEMCSAVPKIVDREFNKIGFDFHSRFQHLYEEHRKSIESDIDDVIEEDRSFTVTASKQPQSAFLPNKSTHSLLTFSRENPFSPTKRTLEDPFSDPVTGVDVSNITRHRKFQVGTRNCVTEDQNRCALSSRSDVESCECVASRFSDSCDLYCERRVSNTLPEVAGCFNLSATESSTQDFHFNTTDRQKDTNRTRVLVNDFCEIDCGVDKGDSVGSFSKPVSSSPPVDMGSPSSWVGDTDKRLPHRCNHNSSPTEVNGLPYLPKGNHGDKGCMMQQTPPIWCLDCHENLVAIGCANGRLEFWEGSTGTFKCLFEDGSGIGITSVKIIGNRVVTAKLNGSVDFLELESYNQGGQQVDWGFTAFHRTHVRSGSTGSLTNNSDSTANNESGVEDLHCIRLNTTRAHQQPITVLDSEGGRVLTGSKDHTLKVFRLEDQLPLYTLHGHCGPITCLFIDRISPMMSGSGSQDGLLCVWDLLTGACMYSLQAHDGSVTALTYSASYVISLGTDERLCVWERFQGHLLNTIQVSHTYCSSMVMFTHNLLITSKQGSLIVWDVRTGEPVRIVKLGHSDGSVFVKQILLLRDSVACDYSNQLRIVRFPLVVTDKCD